MDPSHTIQHIVESLPRTMIRDRGRLMRRLDRIRKRDRGNGLGKDILRGLDELEKKTEASVGEGKTRLAQRPAVSFPHALPIASKAREIIEAIREHQVVIVTGETGSGKSTQIPKMCLEAGRGILGLIGCTQPRRIAATTIARRIAEELGEDIGRSVGYKIRFSDRTSRRAYIKIMTDGILLAETQGDRNLTRYDTIMIDEAHERSLNIDFLLGILRTLLPGRPELKLIITSATLDTEKFSRAFNGAPVIEVSGRMYPVEVEYLPVDPELEDAGDVTYIDMALKAVDGLYESGRFGDTLLFMPTEQDILETCERLEGRKDRDIAVLPLFARLPASRQQRVYSVRGPKIVVATNIAETSLTIPGIRYVIDTGLARISRYLPRTRTTSLPISAVSRSSADQRKGRCGRVRNGVCIRLYSEQDYASRDAHTPPEILRSNLAEVILRMAFLGLGHPASFPFLDMPGPRSIKDGYDLLLELGALEKRGRDFALTDKGRVMARMPLDPRISRMMLEAGKEGCSTEVAVIAAALSIQDPRERPAEKASQADHVHAPFMDADSDFLTLLNIWTRYHRSWKALKTQGRMRKFCKEHFLSFPRMREWVDTHEQITSILREQKISVSDSLGSGTPGERYAGIHRAVLSGFLSNIALRKEKNLYAAARGREVMVFPGSTLFNKNAAWIVAAEMVKTSRLFARTAARIDAGWLEQLGGDLCRRSYFEPCWDKSRGEVRASERVTLYGLVIIPGRSVSYAPVNPEESHEIFIRSALVEGQVRGSFPFLDHNRERIGKIAEMEDKLRRRDVLVSEEAVAEFYSLRLPGVCDIATLKRTIRDKGGDDFLKLREEDLILSRPDETELALYPDEMSLGKDRFKTSYTFSPGKEEDGMTVKIPAGFLSRVPAEPLEWGIPGLFREKIVALIKGLPKRFRKRLVPVSETADVIVREMKRTERPLLGELAEFIHRRFQVDIPAAAWTDADIPDYLKVRISVTDHRGREVRSARDIRLLRETGAPPARKVDSVDWNRARSDWERTGIVAWDFGTLPENIPLGPHLIAYPGLEPSGESVSIRLFSSPEEAAAAHAKGIQVLFSLRFSRDLKLLMRNLPLPRSALRGAGYFGGEKAVGDSIYRTLQRDLFQKDIRSPEAFDAHAEAVSPIMASRGRELRDLAVQILVAYDQIRSALYAIESANPSHAALLEICARIREDLDDLVPKDFIEAYPEERLREIPRYLRAMKIRAERGLHDPGRDRDKWAQAETFLRVHRKMCRDLSLLSSDAKRNAVDDFRWMVEEYKVSLFAQELKTPFPISKKRLEKKHEEIERMV
ncbi:MAG: ATP-dependent RNA helicase HrpA [Deltaproteobacteria bacterium]|nr:ATP-dependent RNA helicase HrpA [Deltaproteobacteria bacterium]